MRNASCLLVHEAAHVSPAQKISYFLPELNDIEVRTRGKQEEIILDPLLWPSRLHSPFSIVSSAYLTAWQPEPQQTTATHRAVCGGAQVPFLSSPPLR